MADLNIGNSTANVKVTLNQNGDVHFRNGSLDFDSSSLPQFNGTPSYLVGIESFANGGTLKWAEKANISVGSADNADKLDNKHANEFIHFSYDTGLGSGSPADIAKSYFVNDDKTPKGMLKGYYNHSGVEYSQLYSRSSSGSYGSILRWGYNNKYMYILRYRNGWQSEDWEKMDAGNADTATKATQDGNGNVITSYYLPKTTYEYNKELAFGSSGKLCIGKFPCYDSNISVEIKSTTNTTYNGTLIIATQNINTSLGGVYKAVVYGDENNTLTNSIKIEYLSGSNVFSVYINLPPWSKNILHIQCVSLAGTPTNIATTVDSIPSTATIVPTNAFIHTHSYAGSSSVGGSATSAVKLDSSAGSATQPVYFSNGKPVATTYTLGASVPSNAKFTDTTYSAGTGLSLSGTTFNHKNSVTAGTAQGDASKTLTFGGTFTIPTITYDAQGHITGKGTTTMTMPANPNTDTHWTTGITAGATGTTSNSATTNGNTFIKIKDNSTHRGQIKLVGSGATSVSSDANGVITISSTDNNTTYGSMSVSEGTTGTATTDRVLTATNLKGIINANISNVVSDAKTEITREYSSLINETASQINLTIDELSRTVNANSDSIVHINNSINVTSQDINLVKTTMSNIQNAVDGKVSADEIKEWARFDGATLELGASNQPFKARLTTTELAFYQGSNKVAWISNNEFHILTTIITQSISCGNFTFVDEGSMGFSLL